MNINEMQAGRELDALVAEKVLGLKMSKGAYNGEPLCFYKDFWRECGKPPVNFSKSIAAAWEIVKAMEQKGFEWLLGTSWKEGEVACKFYNRMADIDVEKSEKTAPLAICRAALKALGV